MMTPPMMSSVDWKMYRRDIPEEDKGDAGRRPNHRESCHFETDALAKFCPMSASTNLKFVNLSIIIIGLSTILSIIVACDICYRAPQQIHQRAGVTVNNIEL